LPDEFHGEVVLEVVAVLTDEVLPAVVLADIRDNSVVDTDIKERLGTLGRWHLAALTVELKDGVLNAILGKINKGRGKQPACEDKESGVDFFIKEVYLALQKLLVCIQISTSLVHA
jgi:hypothetical protein